MAILLHQVSTPILLEQSNIVPLVTMELIFKNSGALSAEQGIAKLASRLLGQGSMSAGSQAFATSLESRAVNISASVGAQTFVVTLSAMKSEFSFGFDKLLELLQSPNYSNDAFENVRNKTIGELTQSASNYDYVASCNLKELLFTNTRAAHSISGSLSSVKNIKLNQLKTHIQKHLGKENLLLAIGGDIDEKEAKKYTQKILGVLPSNDVKEIDFILTSNESQTAQTKIKHTEQAYIYFGSPYNMSYDSKEAYLAKVSLFVLGSSGFGSRLMEEIRVKQGLAYSVYASLHLSKTSTYLSGHMQTKFENADLAIESIRDIFEQFIHKGITKQELDSAKQFLSGSEPLSYETMNQRLSIAFDEYFSGKELGYKKEELRLIESIKLGDINKFILKHNEISKLSFAIVTK